MKILTVVLMAMLTFGLNVGTLEADHYEWGTSELSWSPGATTPGWGGWIFRFGTEWFQFTFSDIDTSLIDNSVTVGFVFSVTNHTNGEAGMDGLIDVVINPGLTPTATYTDVLLDNVDPNNHIYGYHQGGSWVTHGSIEVPKSYIIDGQLIVRVDRHPDSNQAPTAPICTEQPIDMSTTPPTVPPGVYENDDAHTVHIGVTCQDGPGGHNVTGGYYVFVVSDMAVAHMDIKPGSCPNSFNPGSHGVLPVALMSTDQVDITQVDIATIRMLRADGVGGEVAPNEGPPGPHSVFEDVATPFEGELCDCHELDGDGIVDLSMKFRTDDVVAALELDVLDGDVELVVTGMLLDGTLFAATDCIRLVPPRVPGPGQGRLYVESNLDDAYIELTPVDMTLDGGGFADFERVYNQGTNVTLTASDTYGGRSFRRWVVDGVPQTAGQAVVEFTIVEGLMARAVYNPPPLKEPGLGDHGGWPVPVQR